MSPTRRHDPKMRATQDLTAGLESALLLRQYLLDADTKLQEDMIPQLIERIIASFQNSITAMNQCRDGDVQRSGKMMEDSRESCNLVSGLPVRKGRRGCYKRRKGSESWTTVVSTVVDDGQTWRKYGQKLILNAPFPRSYFRCTHKNDQGCLATKQVQQTQMEPPMYTITYDGTHTCTNSLKSASLFIDSAPIPDSSSILLSFNSSESNTYHGRALFGSSDYMLSPEFAPFEGMSSNASSNCSDLEQGMEFMQHEVGNVGMCAADFDELMKLEFEF